MFSSGLAFVHRQWRRHDDQEGIALAVADRITDAPLGLLVLLPSLRTLRRAGFATEGVLRRCLGSDERDDTVVLSRIRSVDGR